MEKENQGDKTSEEDKNHKDTSKRSKLETKHFKLTLLHFRTPPPPPPALFFFFLLMILVQNFMLIKNHIETWV